MTRHDPSVISPARPPSRDRIAPVPIAISGGQGRLRPGRKRRLAIPDDHRTDLTMGRSLCPVIASVASRLYRKPKSP